MTKSFKAWKSSSRPFFSDLLIPSFVGAISIVFLIESYRTPAMTVFGWGPMVFPRWICSLAIVLSLLTVAVNSFGKSHSKRPANPVSIREFVFLLELVGSVALIGFLGYREAMIFFVISSGLTIGTDGRRANIWLWGMFLPIGSWWLFTDVLKVFLP